MKVAFLAMVVLLGALWSASSAEARPGAGPAFLEPRPSAEPDRPGKPARPPKPNIGRPLGAASSERSNSWSYRPGFAAPWSDPSAQSAAPKGRAAPPPAVLGAGQGSFTAFYFWIVVGGALVVLVSAGLQFFRNREDEVWTSGTTSGWTRSPPDGE